MSSRVIYIIILNILDLFGVVAAKFWFINKKPAFLFLTIILFAAAGFVFARSLKYEGMAVMNAMWAAIAIIFSTIIGYFFFKENLTFLQIIGIIVVITGLALINWK